MIEQLFKDLAQFEQVEAIVLGGSRASDCYDEQSDYDIYVYLTESIDEDSRCQLFAKHCQYMEIGNHYWELEDDGVLKNGIEIECIYRHLDDFREEIKSVVRDFQVHNAYTTAMWYNLINSKIVFDRGGRYQALQEAFTISYPKELKDAIVKRQLQLLKTHMPAFPNQIKKSLHRRDLIAVNHRVTEFLASYFELIFALNDLPHPGEKRMLFYAKTKCSLLPERFEENLMALFNHLFDKENTVIVARMVEDVEKLITMLERNIK